MTYTKRVISTIILAAFIANIAFVDTGLALGSGLRAEIDNLAPASRCDDLVGAEHKSIGRIELALEVNLKTWLDGIPPEMRTIEYIKDQLARQVVRDSIFSPAGMHFLFPETDGIIVNGTPYGVVRCDVAEGATSRRYYAVFAFQEAEGGYETAVYTEKEWTRIKEHLTLVSALPKRTGTDRRTIDKYKEVNERGVAAFINRLIAEDTPQNPTFAEIEGMAEELGWPAKYGEGYRPPSIRFSEDLRRTIEREAASFAHACGLTLSDGLFAGRNLVFMRIPPGRRLPVTYETDPATGARIEVPIRSRASNNAIYFFLDSDTFDRLRTDDDKSSLLRLSITPRLIHEMGNVYGLPYRVLGSAIINDFDLLYAASENRKPGERERTIRAIHGANPLLGAALHATNFDEHLPTRDYAAGEKSAADLGELYAIIMSLAGAQDVLENGALTAGIQPLFLVSEAGGRRAAERLRREAVVAHERNALINALEGVHDIDLLTGVATGLTDEHERAMTEWARNEESGGGLPVSQPREAYYRTAIELVDARIAALRTGPVLCELYRSIAYAFWTHRDLGVFRSSPTKLEWNDRTERYWVSVEMERDGGVAVSKRWKGAPGTGFENEVYFFKPNGEVVITSNSVLTYSFTYTGGVRLLERIGTDPTDLVLGFLFDAPSEAVMTTGGYRIPFGDIPAPCYREGAMPDVVFRPVKPFDGWMVEEAMEESPSVLRAREQRQNLARLTDIIIRYVIANNINLYDHRYQSGGSMPLTAIHERFRRYLYQAVAFYNHNGRAPSPTELDRIPFRQGSHAEELLHEASIDAVLRAEAIRAARDAFTDDAFSAAAKGILTDMLVDGPAVETAMDALFGSVYGVRGEHIVSATFLAALMKRVDESAAEARPGGRAGKGHEGKSPGAALTVILLELSGKERFALEDYHRAHARVCKRHPEFYFESLTKHWQTTVTNDLNGLVEKGILKPPTKEGRRNTYEFTDRYKKIVAHNAWWLKKLTALNKAFAVTCEFNTTYNAVIFSRTIGKPFPPSMEGEPYATTREEFWISLDRGDVRFQRIWEPRDLSRGAPLTKTQWFTVDSMKVNNLDSSEYTFIYGRTSPFIDIAIADHTFWTRAPRGFSHNELVYKGEVYFIVDRAFYRTTDGKYGPLPNAMLTLIPQGSFIPPEETQWPADRPPKRGAPKQKGKSADDALKVIALSPILQKAFADAPQSGFTRTIGWFDLATYLKAHAEVARFYPELGFTTISESQARNDLRELANTPWNILEIDTSQKEYRYGPKAERPVSARLDAIRAVYGSLSGQKAEVALAALIAITQTRGYHTRLGELERVLKLEGVEKDLVSAAEEIGREYHLDAEATAQSLKGATHRLKTALEIRSLGVRGVLMALRLIVTDGLLEKHEGLIQEAVTAQTRRLKAAAERSASADEEVMQGFLARVGLLLVDKGTASATVAMAQSRLDGLKALRERKAAQEKELGQAEAKKEAPPEDHPAAEERSAPPPAKPRSEAGSDEGRLAEELPAPPVARDAAGNPGLPPLEGTRSPEPTHVLPTPEEWVTIVRALEAAAALESNMHVDTNLATLNELEGGGNPDIAQVIAAAALLAWTAEHRPKKTEEIALHREVLARFRDTEGLRTTAGQIASFTLNERERGHQGYYVHREQFKPLEDEMAAAAGREASPAPVQREVPPPAAQVPGTPAPKSDIPTDREWAEIEAACAAAVKLEGRIALDTTRAALNDMNGGGHHAIVRAISAAALYAFALGQRPPRASDIAMLRSILESLRGDQTTDSTARGIASHALNEAKPGGAGCYVHIEQLDKLKVKVAARRSPGGSGGTRHLGGKSPEDLARVIAHDGSLLALETFTSSDALRVYVSGYADFGYEPPADNRHSALDTINRDLRTGQFSLKRLGYLTVVAEPQEVGDDYVYAFTPEGRRFLAELIKWDNIQSVVYPAIFAFLKTEEARKNDAGLIFKTPTEVIAYMRKRSSTGHGRDRELRIDRTFAAIVEQGTLAQAPQHNGLPGSSERPTTLDARNFFDIEMLENWERARDYGGLIKSLAAGTLESTFKRLSPVTRVKVRSAATIVLPALRSLAAQVNERERGLTAATLLDRYLVDLWGNPADTVWVNVREIIAAGHTLYREGGDTVGVEVGSAPIRTGLNPWNLDDLLLVREAILAVARAASGDAECVRILQHLGVSLAEGDGTGTIAALVENANAAGRDIPIDPENRYTFIMPFEFYADGEFDAHRALYGARLNLERVGGQTGDADAFVRQIITAAGRHQGSKAVAFVPDTLTKEQLARLTEESIRFVRTDMREMVTKKEEHDPDWDEFQRTTYVVMALVRRIDENITSDSPVWRTLSFLLTSHFSLGGAAADAYIKAIKDDKVALLINGLLMYRPSEQYQAPEYKNVVAAVIAA